MIIKNISEVRYFMDIKYLFLQKLSINITNKQENSDSLCHHYKIEFIKVWSCVVLPVYMFGRSWRALWLGTTSARNCGRSFNEAWRTLWTLSDPVNLWLGRQSVREREWASEFYESIFYSLPLQRYSVVVL